MKMKTKFLKITSLLLFVATILACEDEQVKPKEDGNPETKAVVTTKTSLDRITFNMFGENFKTNVGGRRSARIHRFSGLFKSKGEAARIADDWDTCALVTITENADGTWTIILNFGEGCVDGEKFIKGVVAFTGSETDTSGVFKIAFDKFHERLVSQEEEEDPATLSGFYNGIWAANPADGFSYGEGFETALEVNYESGAKINLAAEGQLTGNQQGFVVPVYNFVASNSNSDVFSGTVVHPLLFDYSCTESRIFTKGTEAFQVNGEGAVVDYGQGECDNILTITQEGIVIIVDLDKVNS
jgi:hypothetical protein